MTTLVTTSGKRVPELTLYPSLFIDRTTVIYGPSKTGKTVIVKNIMKQVYGHIEQILIISPTEPSNRSYNGFVDSSLIHYRMHLPDPTDKKDTDIKASMRFLDITLKSFLRYMPEYLILNANREIIILLL